MHFQASVDLDYVSITSHTSSQLACSHRSSLPVGYPGETCVSARERTDSDRNVKGRLASIVVRSRPAVGKVGKNGRDETSIPVSVRICMHLKRAQRGQSRRTGEDGRWSALLAAASSLPASWTSSGLRRRISESEQWNPFQKKARGLNARAGVAFTSALGLLANDSAFQRV